jgi:hypothetical protein
MYSAGSRVDFIHAGFPIRRSTDRRLLTAPRRLTQFCHVLHRLLVPRHPPNALTSLTTETMIAPGSSLGGVSAAGEGRARCVPAIGQVRYLSLFAVFEEYLSDEVARSFPPAALAAGSF